jgi:hypothetical protein
MGRTLARRTDLFQLVDQIRSIEFDLIICIMKTSFDDLVHDMKIAYIIG